MKFIVLMDNCFGGERNFNKKLIKSLKDNFPNDDWITYVIPDKQLGGILSGTRKLAFIMSHFQAWVTRQIPNTVSGILALSSSSRLLLPWIRKRHPSLVITHLYQAEIDLHHKLTLERQHHIPHSLFKIPQYVYSLAYTRYLHRLHCLALHSANNIITLSKSVPTNLRDEYNINPDNIIVIQPGVDHAIFKPSRQGKKQIANRFRLFRKYKAVLYCGRIDPIKGIENLYLALKTISRHTPILLIIAHPKIQHHHNYANWLKTNLNQSGDQLKIRFINNLPGKKLSWLYQTACSVILPSSCEVAPCVMYEALASGAIFIGNHVGTIPEVLREIDTKLILKDTKPETIAYTLNYVFSLPTANRKGLIKRGIKITSNLTWDKVALKIYSILNIPNV